MFAKRDVVVGKKEGGGKTNYKRKKTSYLGLCFVVEEKVEAEEGDGRVVERLAGRRRERRGRGRERSTYL